VYTIVCTRRVHGINRWRDTRFKIQITDRFSRRPMWLCHDGRSYYCGRTKAKAVVFQDRESAERTAANVWWRDVSFRVVEGQVDDDPMADVVRAYGGGAPDSV
jgi:hypothetical protein